MALDSRFAVLNYSNDDGSCRDGRRGTMQNFWAPENEVITCVRRPLLVALPRRRFGL